MYHAAHVSCSSGGAKRFTHVHIVCHHTSFTPRLHIHSILFHFLASNHCCLHQIIVIHPQLLSDDTCKVVGHNLWQYVCITWHEGSKSAELVLWLSFFFVFLQINTCETSIKRTPPSILNDVLVHVMFMIQSALGPSVSINLRILVDCSTWSAKQCYCV